MENFDIDFTHKKNNDAKNKEELNMQVSPVCNKDGRKVVYVTFSDGTRLAEGEIPKCAINSNKGFSPEEVAGLELYLRQNMDMLKEMAAGINPIRAMFK